MCVCTYPCIMHTHLIVWWIINIHCVFLQILASQVWLQPPNTRFFTTSWSFTDLIIWKWRISTQWGWSQAINSKQWKDKVRLACHINGHHKNSDRHATTTRNQIIGNRTSTSPSLTTEEPVVVLEQDCSQTLYCVILYNSIEIHNRWGYNVEPCNHILHRDCLMQ